MVSHNSIRLEEVQGGRTAKTKRRDMVRHDTTSNKDQVFRGAADMTIDLSQFSHVSGMKYGEPLSDPTCVCGFEKVLSAEQLIDFGDSVRPVMDCIKQLSTRQQVYNRIVSLYFVTRFLTALVTGPGVPAWGSVTMST